MYASTVEASQPDELQSIQSVEIRVRGTVQGVGFRPTVWRLARDNALAGEVLNDSAGVLIRATGAPARIADFLRALRSEAPPLSRIEAVEVRALADIVAFEGFRIVSSVGGETRTNVTPDAATCAACRAEVLDPSERRFHYPFANCTHCGPRLSIVTGVPYDRAHTSMASFPMCAECAREYDDPADRRFHAQPIACAVCGPKVWLEMLDGSAVGSSPIEDVVRQLREGRIVAIRGLGGFHLACDATNAEAVQRLRARKRRFGKPFALMARDADMIARYAPVSAEELALLRSAAAPIVLLQADGPERLPEAVAPSLGTLGFMLPYTPLHILVCESIDVPLVMTSGNVVHEPQVTDNAEVRAKLAGIADSVLFHDRDIANRIDDSVVRVMAGRPRFMRRARGYAPAPTKLPPGFADAPDILAFGGEVKSTFCLIRGGAAILSQHQGDLEDVATFDDYQKNMRLYRDLYSHAPRVFAADMHPEYLSTKLAKEMAAQSGAKVHAVQHHHAHIASTLAENGVALAAPPVLGVVMDGLGFGADGTIWGGEFLRADYLGFERLAALKPVAMIGGVQAIREPWRNAYAHIVAAFGWEAFEKEFGGSALALRLAGKPRGIIDQMLADGINVPVASSCGRLFDAVAAALGLSPDVALFEGQAAMELEDLIDEAARTAAPYVFEVTDGDLPLIEPRPMWRALLNDLRDGVPAPVMSARFHLGLASCVCDLAMRLARENGIGTLALSGGCFQNKVLFEACVARIEAAGLVCLTQAEVTTNDGGLSLGQAIVAAAREIVSKTRN